MEKIRRMQRLLTAASIFTRIVGVGKKKADATRRLSRSVLANPALSGISRRTSIAGEAGLQQEMLIFRRRRPPSHVEVYKPWFGIVATNDGTYLRLAFFSLMKLIMQVHVYVSIL